MERDRVRAKNVKVNVIHEKTFIISPLPATTFNETESVTNEFFRYGFGFFVFWFQQHFPDFVFFLLSCYERKSTRKLFCRFPVEIFPLIYFPIWLVLSLNGIHTQVWLQEGNEAWNEAFNCNLREKTHTNLCHMLLIYNENYCHFSLPYPCFTFASHGVEFRTRKMSIAQSL